MEEKKMNATLSPEQIKDLMRYVGQGVVVFGRIMSNGCTQPFHVPVRLTGVLDDRIEGEFPSGSSFCSHIDLLCADVRELVERVTYGGMAIYENQSAQQEVAAVTR